MEHRQGGLLCLDVCSLAEGKGRGKFYRSNRSSGVGSMNFSVGIDDFREPPADAQALGGLAHDVLKHFLDSTKGQFEVGLRVLAPYLRPSLKLDVHWGNGILMHRHMLRFAMHILKDLDPPTDGAGHLVCPVEGQQPPKPLNILLYH